MQEIKIGYFLLKFLLIYKSFSLEKNQLAN